MNPRMPDPRRAGRRRRRPVGPIRMLLALALLALASGATAGEQWGWLGVRIRDLTEQEMEEITKKVGVSEGYGVLIAQVMKETPAADSGLREGDLIVAIDGRPIVETRSLQRLVGATPAGRSGSNSRRSRESVVWSEASGEAGGCSPHNLATSRSTGTTRP